MATFSLNNYLLNLLRNNHAEFNELPVSPKNSDFDLYSLYLERQHQDSIDYIADTATLLFCLTGSLIVSVRDADQELKSGNIIFLEAKTKYRVSAVDSQTLLLKLKMKPKFSWLKKVSATHASSVQEKSLVTSFKDNLTNSGYMCFNNTSVMWPTQILKQMITEYMNGNLFMWAMAKNYLGSILYGSLRMQMFAVQAETADVNFEDQSLDEYIDAHYNDISLEKAAEYFGFNKNYFSSLVKEKTGKSFVDHVDDHRMHEAKRLLAEPSISLKEIIERVGYSSKSFFYKKFNRYYGMTPAAMRKRLFQQANINLK